ncbi:hypothetical protein EOA25_04390 [Mesorhizobium sp. M2A.F.Ca.ET.040.01.1.1]|nr:hypothetical protein EOA25_04390 [Mesorhizobium sp. M2A.F.Ca.ET.040.01.1.1]
MAKASKTKAQIQEAAGNTETSGSAAAPASDAPSSGAATGTNSTDDPPESDGQGGAGNTAGSAESEAPDVQAGSADAEFRAEFPRFSAELDAWKAEHGDELPAGLRIKSKVEGFRRGGIAHSKAAVDHPIEAFKSPEQLEAIFAEPKLKVELI